jgi:tetratricopeptide (TPR) repeat protein
MKTFSKKPFSSHVLLALFVVYCSAVFAAEEKAYLLEQNTHFILIESHKYIEEGQNAKALIKLKKLVSSDKIKDYDAAVINQTMGFAENNLGNFDTAAKHFIKALSLDALPKDVTHELNYSTAQLLIHIDKPKEALKYLSKWFSNEPKAKGDAHILAATAYYYVKDYKQLIIHVEKALASSNNPPLNWYELLLTGYYETKEYTKSASLLETIIVKHSEKTVYWLQLAEIYQRLKQDKKALAIYELAYTKELLKKDDILRLINNYLYLEMPYKAAMVLEKGMAIGDINPDIRMLTLLADSWLLSQENEKAEPVFKEIITKFNDDTTRLRLGQLYIEAEKWEKTIEVLDVKLQSDDNVLMSKVNLLLGIAQYHSENLGKATRAFTHALSDKSTKEQANWWLEHLKNKTTKTQDS